MTFRSNHSEVLSEKDVVKNFAKVAGKQLCPSFFINKVADLMLATFLKKRLWQRPFPVDFAKFLEKRDLFKNTTTASLH